MPLDQCSLLDAGDGEEKSSQRVSARESLLIPPIIPMTHAPETGAINRLHFSGAGFWYVCHANLGPDSSDARFRRRLGLEHCSTPSQTPGHLPD